MILLIVVVVLLVAAIFVRRWWRGLPQLWEHVISQAQFDRLDRQIKKFALDRGHEWSDEKRRSFINQMANSGAVNEGTELHRMLSQFPTTNHGQVSHPCHPWFLTNDGWIVARSSTPELVRFADGSLNSDGSRLYIADTDFNRIAEERFRED